MAHISEYPAALKFLTSYWFETADLVYGKDGIRAAAQQYVDDYSQAGDLDGACQRLSADLMRLMQSGFIREPDWKSAPYHEFWNHRGVHRALTESDVATVLSVLRIGVA